MLSLIKILLQLKNSYKPSWLDLIPRGRYGGAFVFADCLMFLLLFRVTDIINDASLVTGIVVTLVFAAMLSYCILSTSEEIDKQKREIKELKSEKRKNGINNAERDAYVTRIENELTSMRSRGRRSSDNFEALLEENRQLRKKHDTIKKENKKLIKDIDSLKEQKVILQEPDEDLTALMLENNSLKSEVSKLKAELSQKHYNNQDKPNWASYIPYVEGDEIGDIKIAYRALAKANHPDNEGKEERMKKLNQAWEEAQKWFGDKKK